MLETLRKLFTLKPYGNNLLDGVAETWMVLAALNILSIAFCDAVAWAYFGYTTATGTAAYVSAAVAGLVVLMLVGSVDAMFVMHDRSRRRTDEKEEEPADGSVWQRLRRNVRRDHVAVVARIILVILTFTVTAPFLTQLFFARDIEANIKRRNVQTVASKRQEVATNFDRRIDGARTLLTARHRDLEREIAGTGASGRYGKGPTSDAIGRDIQALQTQIAALESAKSVELQTFDGATPDVLANRYGVDLVRQGPDTRARVLAEMETSPSFRTTRRNIKAFLVFMFLGLVCLKLFQPESVRIYYDARLQAAYARMLAGAFSHRLDPREQPGLMNPIRFADWFENGQQMRDATDRLRDQTATAIERLETQEGALQSLSGTLHSDIARLRDDLAATARTGDEIEQQTLACRQELAALNAKIADEQQALDDFRYDMSDDLSLRDQQLLIGSRSKTVRRLAEHRAAAAALESKLARLTSRLETTSEAEKQLRDALAAAGSEAASLTRALQEARLRKATDISTM